MLVLTPKYNNQNDIDLFKKKKEQKEEPQITHRRIIDLNTQTDIMKAYDVWREYCQKPEYYIKPYIAYTIDELRSFTKHYYYTKSFTVSWIDVSQLDTLDYCFSGCGMLETIIGLDKWDVSNVKCMNSIFANCLSLKELDLNAWNTSSVVNLTNAFCGCRQLKTLNISSWDVSNVRFMYNMFMGCRELEQLDLSNWQTHKLERIDKMFCQCNALKSIGNVDGWDISSIYKRGWSQTFIFCPNLPLPAWYRSKSKK